MATNEFKVTVKNPEELTVRMPDGYTLTKKDLPRDYLRERTIEYFNEWLGANRESTRELMVILGSHLYELLFPGDVDQNFKTSFDKYQDQTLRVVLEFEPIGPRCRGNSSMSPMASGVRAAAASSYRRTPA
jgi:hypothetical protein